MRTAARISFNRRDKFLAKLGGQFFSKFRPFGGVVYRNGTRYGRSPSGGDYVFAVAGAPKIFSVAVQGVNVGVGVKLVIKPAPVKKIFIDRNIFRANVAVVAQENCQQLFVRDFHKLDKTRAVGNCLTIFIYIETFQRLFPRTGFLFCLGSFLQIFRHHAVGIFLAEFSLEIFAIHSQHSINCPDI